MFHTVLFDIDGVMLSEERYFDASALTVYELLTSPAYLGLSIEGLPPFSVDLSEDTLRCIRHSVFAADEVLQTMKSRGVNANWDMVYLQTAFVLTTYLRQALAQGTLTSQRLQQAVTDGWTQPVLQQIGAQLRVGKQDLFPDVFQSYASVFDVASSKSDLFQGLDNFLYDSLDVGGLKVLPMSTNRQLWDVGQQCFQEWYLGDKYISSTVPTGKRGFLSEEVPLIPPAHFSALLGKLHAAKVTMGIGTGRPAIETHVPLTELGWMRWFSEARVSTASDVLLAESTFPEYAPLSKPHPYSYLRSFLASSEIEEVLQHMLPLASEVGTKVLIVGDSVADLLAAQRMGCSFAAVLTGLDGVQARETFVELGATYIVDTVLDVENIIFGLSP